MKLLTVNFLTCAVKACKSSPSSFPLHFKDAVLERTEITFNPLFITNILPRLNWEALKVTVTEVGLAQILPEKNPVEVQEAGGDEDGKATRAGEVDMEVDKEEEADVAVAAGGGEGTKAREETLKKLHGLLLETGVVEGKLVCGNCGFEYPIKEGVGNFLLPAHLV